MNSKASERIYLIVVLAFLISTGSNVNADFTFGEPINLGPDFNRGMQDMGVSLSTDGLSLFFASRRSGGLEGYDIWIAVRATINDDWSEPVKLGPTVNKTDQSEWDPSISSDGLELYFSRGPGKTNHDLFVTMRETTNDEWCTAVSLGEMINSSAEDGDPCISTDGLSLYFSSSRTGGEGNRDLYVTTRLTKNDAWSTPVNLGPIINSSSNDIAPSITPDGLTLLFSSKRPGKYSNYYDLWMTRRRTASDPWGEPINLGPIINTDDLDFADISPDGQTLYLSCWNRPGGYGLYDIWQTSIIPIVDFNGDGFVDSADMCIIVDHWGEDYSLCDIGPTPFGDGIVDVQDLIVLAEHLLPVFLAHWELDETEGGIARDSVGGHDGTLNGEPLWQPTGGRVGGALQLDGIDDYLSTPFIVDPAKGSLSVFAWIKDGALGQAIISQIGGFGGTWLGTNLSEGKLITRLSDMYFGTLDSESVITDGQWHHIGLVYDSDAFHRRLYVDGIEVAEDTTVVAGIPSDGGLYIGASKDLDAGSFFSGLIDDIRIYNVALTADEIDTLMQ
ncbi:MAG: PD40 domain-containing protein [Planctomycetes bacterium]|nr:PD40 domain-containing protein [Planctomycetota bacterium]MBL7144974.1 PD40 domain-containing protein [Phycisphaerae bacterium]